MKVYAVAGVQFNAIGFSLIVGCHCANSEAEAIGAFFLKVREDTGKEPQSITVAVGPETDCVSN